MLISIFVYSVVVTATINDPVRLFLSTDQISVKTLNPKCWLFLKIDQLIYLAAGVYLSEAPNPPPSVTLCMNTYRCTYHTGKVGREGG